MGLLTVSVDFVVLATGFGADVAGFGGAGMKSSSSSSSKLSCGLEATLDGIGVGLLTVSVDFVVLATGFGADAAGFGGAGMKSSSSSSSKLSCGLEATLDGIGVGLLTVSVDFVVLATGFGADVAGFGGAGMKSSS